MNAYDIAQTKKLIPLTDKEFYNILTSGIPTGSYVFGGFTLNISDMDIALHDFNVEQIKDYEKKVYVSGNSSDQDDVMIESCYALNPDKYPINLLFFKDKELYKKWKKATKLMIKLKEIPRLARQFEDKKKRVQMFEFLKDNFV